MLRAAVVVLLVLGVAACTWAPDRADEAAAIEAELWLMPGVFDAHVFHSNNITQGVRFEVTVDMPTASDQQIADVAQRITELKGDDFVEYEQELTIRVTPDAGLIYGATVDPAQVAHDSAAIRSLEPEIIGVTLDRSDSIAAIEVYYTTAPWDELGVLQQVFGTEQLEIHLWNTKQPNHFRPTIEGQFPLTAEQYTRIREQAAALPGEPTVVTIEDGAITEMVLRLPDPATLYDDLAAMFVMLGAGPDQPLFLRYSAPGIEGYVEVGSCDNEPHGPEYQSGERHPDNPTVQRRLLDEFSTC